MKMVILLIKKGKKMTHIIFKEHLKNLNRLNSKIKNEELKDLILLKNLIQNIIQGYSKKDIELAKNNINSIYLYPYHKSVEK
tara:strand:- start:421 stop:666 length:246 start_codon:yes stop_codon:yes gene_type:complete